MKFPLCHELCHELCHKICQNSNNRLTVFQRSFLLLQATKVNFERPILFMVIRRVHCIKNCLTLLYVKGVLKPTPPQAAPSDAFQSGPNGFKFLETNSLLRAYFLKNLFWPTVSTSPRSIVSFHNRERWWSHTARKRTSSEDYFCAVLPFAHYARI